MVEAFVDRLRPLIPHRLLSVDHDNNSRKVFSLTDVKSVSVTYGAKPIK